MRHLYFGMQNGVVASSDQSNQTKRLISASQKQPSNSRNKQTRRFKDNTTPMSNSSATNAGMSVTFTPPPPWHTTHAPLSHCGSSLHHHASNVSPAHINSYAPWVPTTTPRPPSCPKNDTGWRDVAPSPPPKSYDWTVCRQLQWPSKNV